MVDVPIPRADPRFERYDRGGKTVTVDDQVQKYYSPSQYKANVLGMQSSFDSYRKSLDYKDPER